MLISFLCNYRSTGRAARRLAFAITGAGLLIAAPVAFAASTAVVPIQWSEFTGGNPADTDSVRIKDILRNANKYGLNTWYNSVKNYDAQTGAYLTFGGTAEPNIRPPAGEAYSLAVAIATGAYDAAYTGVTLTDAKAIATRLIASVAYRHRVTTSGGWGNDWQTALWAAYAGTAGWLLWDDLSTTDREYVRKMVEYEVNRFNSATPPVYRNTAGTIVSPGDSKGEENAWNATIMQLAVAMMPAHPNAPVWADKSVEYMVSGFSRPADLTNATYMNGRPVSGWLVNGTNIENNGTMINHGRIHPDYTATVSSNLSASLVSTLAQLPTPNAALFNADLVYSAVVDLSFSSPPYAAPGGTFYVVGSDSIYYPQGNDWGTGRRIPFAALDVFSRFLGTDSLASLKGFYWEPYHAQKVLDMQGRFTDGHTYLDNTEDNYSAKEEMVAFVAGRTYLTKWVAAQGLFALTNASYALPFSASFTSPSTDAWTPVGGSWSVSGGEYQQSSTAGAALAVTGAPVWSDYAVQAKVKNVASGTGTIGLAGRYQDTSNYYFVTFDRVANNFKLYRKVGGTNTQLGVTYADTWTVGSVKTIKLSFAGTSVRVSVDGSEVIAATDATFVRGSAALRTYQNGASFDDVAISVPFTSFSDDFSDGIADGWSVSGGTWNVAAGEYVQSSTSGAAFAVVGTGSWTDYAFKARIENAASGTGTMGLLGRYQDASNYYFVAYDRAGATFTLYKKVGGTNTQLGATYSATWAAGASKDVTLTFSGSTVKVSVDGADIITATDATFSAGGGGLRTYNNAATFDDVVVN